MKAYVTVSRKWNNPAITTAVSREGIVIAMPIDDFASAMKAEIGKVTFVFTKAEFEKRFDEALKTVVEGIKEESAKVM